MASCALFDFPRSLSRRAPRECVEPVTSASRRVCATGCGRHESGQGEFFFKKRHTTGRIGNLFFTDPALRLVFIACSPWRHAAGRVAPARAGHLRGRDPGPRTRRGHPRHVRARRSARSPPTPTRPRAGSRTTNLPVGRGATRSGRTSPTTSGTTGAGRSQNAIRSVRQLRDLLPFTPDELEAIGRLEGEYKLAIPPYYFSLIDPDDPRRPDPPPVGARRRWRPRTRPGTSWKTRSKRTRTRRSPGLTHRYPDRALLVTTPRLHHVLPVLHAQAGHA